MDSNVISFPKLVMSCGDCPWARSCVASSDSRSTTDNGSQRCTTPLKRLSHVFHQGERLEYLYVLRSGSAKSYFDNADGLEQIVSFH